MTSYVDANAHPTDMAPENSDATFVRERQVRVLARVGYRAAKWPGWAGRYYRHRLFVLASYSNEQAVAEAATRVDLRRRGLVNANGQRALTPRTANRIRRSRRRAAVFLAPVGFLVAVPFLSSSPALGAKAVSILVVMAVAYCHTGSWLLGYRNGQIDGDRHHRQEMAEAVTEERRKAAAEVAALTAPATPCDLAFDSLPALPGEGYLYVIEFDTGVVKVGQTVDPRRRFGEHARDAGAFGNVITDYWISQPHVGYLVNEMALINICRDRAPVAKREYFHGLPFGEAVDFASSIVQTGDQKVVQ